MTTIRDISRVSGTVFNLPHAMSLSPSDCNVLVVSSRTLFFVQLFGTGEMDYIARYASQFLDGNKYVLAEDSSELDDINDLVNNYELEVQPVTCDLVAAIEALTAATISAGSGCCTPYGEGYPPPAPNTGNPAVDPPPEDWSTWASYYTYKCKAANMITDDWISTLNGMSTLSGIVSAIGALALAAFLSTSLLGGLIVGLMALGFAAGTAAAIIIGALVLMVLSGAGLLLYFAEVADVIETNKADLVCALYNATSVVFAKAAIISFTTDIAADLTYDPGDDGTLFQAQLSSLADALFNDAIINTLFELNPDANVYVGDVDCDDCAQDQAAWIIAPSGAYNATSAEGTLGTGTVWNNGQEFTISSVLNTQAGEPNNIICLMVRAQDATAFCEGYDGEFEITSWPTNQISNYAYKCVDAGECGEAVVNVPMSGVGIYTDYVMMLKQWNTPVTMSFRINTPPTLCP